MENTLSSIKRMLSGRIYVVISPPSLYLTEFMTLKECKSFVDRMVDYGNYNHIIVRDISGKFSKNYPMKYPVTRLILKS